jgi:hypothetical protein
MKPEYLPYSQQPTTYPFPVKRLKPFMFNHTQLIIQPYNIFKISFNIILLLSLGLPIGFFFKFKYQKTVCTCFPHTCHMPRHLNLMDRSL